MNGENQSMDEMIRTETTMEAESTRLDGAEEMLPDEVAEENPEETGAESMTGPVPAKENRSATYDVIRILSTLCVMMIHTVVKPFESNFLLTNVMMTFLFLANTFFYMLSGRFNLVKTFDTPADYGKFYKKKIITILLPYIVVSMLLSVFNMMMQGAEIRPKSYLLFAYWELMETNIGLHLWFMYPLMGFLLSTPFFAKLFHAMSDAELRIMFAVAIFWNVASINLTKNIGANFAYSGWMLTGFAFTYVNGYLCYRLINDKNRKILYLIGLVSFAITIYGKTWRAANFENSLDLSVFFIAFSMAAFVFLERHIKIRNASVAKVISFIAQHTFLMYMIHWTMERYFVVDWVITDSPTLAFLGVAGLTFVVTLGIAIVLRLILIKPLQWVFGKLLRA